MLAVHQNNTRRFYVTALSNFALGYDRYGRKYSKRDIRQSRFPSQFFLLEKSDIQIGQQRAQKLVQKLNLPHDDIIVLETVVEPSLLHENIATGIGQFIESDSIDLEAVHSINNYGLLMPMQLEDAYAKSMKASRQLLPAWQELSPRTISILPIAKGCQADCPFCFSEGSISENKLQAELDNEKILAVIKLAKVRGAERAVITGGGEPGLLPLTRLCDLIRMVSANFKKVVLITNGFFLSNLGEDERRNALCALTEAGLTVLAISRHHYDPIRHKGIMRLSTECERIVDSWHAIRSKIQPLKLRWICVLQKGGIDTSDEVNAYIRWASSMGVEEICFKELYVSSGIESIYYNSDSNHFSAQHQVPLKVVMDLANLQSWECIFKLPWGAPVFKAIVGKTAVSVAAYTEPSVMWELRNSICRSWNLMADGKCYASLEDRQSLLEIP